MAANDVTERAVRALIAAINAGDREAFFAALTPDATMSDDGTDRDLARWADREVFTVHGRLDVISAGDGGRSMSGPPPEAAVKTILSARPLLVGLCQQATFAAIAKAESNY